MDMQRRRFLQRLGLSAGAALLTPMVSSLVREAHGLEPQRKRIVLVVEGNGFDGYDCFPPPEVRPLSDWPAPVTLQSSQFTLPRSLTALQKYKDRMLMIQNLTNHQNASDGHSCGITGLTCMSSPDRQNIAGGESFDQYLGRHFAATNPYGVLAMGITHHDYHHLSLAGGTLASGPEKTVPYRCKPREIFDELFSSIGGSDNVMAREAELRSAKKRAVIAGIKDDVKRVQAALGSVERAKMEQYLSAIESIEQRQSLLDSAGSGECAPPSRLLLDSLETHERLQAEFEIASAALICNLTQVVVIVAGCSSAFFDLSFNLPGVDKGKHGLGHRGGADWKLSLDIIHNFHAAQIAAMADRLDAVPEGDGTMLDNTTIVYLNENGDNHHGGGGRWPAVIVGDCGGFLKTDGRYIRYGQHKTEGAGKIFMEGDDNHALGDLFCTLAHAMGAPTDDFGAGGLTEVKGPIDSLIA
jgi:hypothetical protein